MEKLELKFIYQKPTRGGDNRGGLIGVTVPPGQLVWQRPTSLSSPRGKNLPANLKVDEVGGDNSLYNDTGVDCITTLSRDWLYAPYNWTV